MSLHHLSPVFNETRPRVNLVRGIVSIVDEWNVGSPCVGPITNP